MDPFDSVEIGTVQSDEGRGATTVGAFDGGPVRVVIGARGWADGMALTQSDYTPAEARQLADLLRAAADAAETGG